MAPKLFTRIARPATSEMARKASAVRMLKVTAATVSRSTIRLGLRGLGTAGARGTGAGAAATWFTATHWAPFHHQRPSAEYCPFCTTSAAGTARAAGTAWPQRSQKRASGVRPAPQDEQVRARPAPQLEQNADPG